MKWKMYTSHREEIIYQEQRSQGWWDGTMAILPLGEAISVSWVHFGRACAQAQALNYAKLPALTAVYFFLYQLAFLWMSPAWSHRGIIA